MLVCGRQTKLGNKMSVTERIMSRILIDKYDFHEKLISTGAYTTAPPEKKILWLVEHHVGVQCARAANDEDNQDILFRPCSVRKIYASVGLLLLYSVAERCTLCVNFSSCKVGGMLFCALTWALIYFSSCLQNPD